MEERNTSPQWIMSCAVRSACPHCGKGKIFNGFLRLAKRCNVCVLVGFAQREDGVIPEIGSPARVFSFLVRIRPRVRTLADNFDADYLGTGPQHLLEIARKLERDGLVQLEGEQARPADALISHAAKFEGAMKAALEALHAKHAFERG